MQILQVSTANRSTNNLTIFNRDSSEKDPAFSKAIQWTYLTSTGTTGLRKHIKNHHKALYESLCKEHKIKPSEAIVDKTVSNDIPIVPPTREPFNKDTLLAYIRNFVIADDQVSFKSEFNVHLIWQFFLVYQCHRVP